MSSDFRFAYAVLAVVFGIAVLALAITPIVARRTGAAGLTALAAVLTALAGLVAAFVVVLSLMMNRAEAGDRPRDRDPPRAVVEDLGDG